MSKFGTVINCMDGRVQLCVNEYVKQKYNIEFVDTVTAAGPCKIISKDEQKRLVHNINYRLDISVNGHGSNYIAVVGHHDCAGVPDDDDTHKLYVLESVTKVKEWYPDAIVEAIWVNDKFEVEILK